MPNRPETDKSPRHSTLWGAVLGAIVSPFLAPPVNAYLAKSGYITFWEGDMNLAAIPISAGIGAIIGWALNWVYAWYFLGGRHERSKVYAVNRAFTEAYSHAGQAGIGKPIGKAKRGGFATWTVFKNAAVLWLKDTNCIYQLPLDRETRAVKSVNDPRASGEYFRPEVVRKKLGLSDDIDPPWGGIALAWERDPENWKWIGDRRFRCEVRDRELLVQRFERGLIVGFMPAGENTDDKVAVWLVDGGAWQTVEVGR